MFFVCTCPAIQTWTLSTLVYTKANNPVHILPYIHMLAEHLSKQIMTILC